MRCRAISPSLEQRSGEISVYPKREADVGICSCAEENQNLHLLWSYCPGETMLHEAGMVWEGRMKEKSMTLSEGCSSTQMSYKHHLAHALSRTKGSQRSWSATPQQKVGFPSKEIRPGSAIKPLATGPCRRVRSVKQTKTNRTVFPWITDEKMVGLPNTHSLRSVQQREPLTNCWCAARWEQLL